VILDIFTELQRAEHPWDRTRERALIDDTLAQAQLADELGYGCWWTVEHHGTGDFSLSSTPEMFNLLVAERTQRIRIGHSGVLAPFAINHPVRVAERAAFLDVMSGGRLELGIARSGFGEGDNFQLDRDMNRPQLAELVEVLPRMWAEDRFEWSSDLLTVPPINIVPKPLQSPHPPLWQMCVSGESFEMAGRLGVGAIGTTLLDPIHALKQLRDTYFRGIEEARATAAPGRVIDGRFGIFTFVHCAASREEAIAARAGEAVLWYVNNVPTAFKTPRKIMIDSFRGTLDAGTALNAMSMGGEDEEIWDPDDPVPVIRLLNRQLLGMPLDPEEVYDVLEPIDGVIVGDPDLCVEKMRRVAEIGVDRLLCFQQFGALSNDAVRGSIERVAREVMPMVSGGGAST